MLCLMMKLHEVSFNIVGGNVTGNPCQLMNVTFIIYSKQSKLLLENSQCLLKIYEYSCGYMNNL